MKKLLLFCSVLLSSATGFAQLAAQYGFSAFPGTYTNLPASATGVTAIQVDDQFATNIPIGFNFNFCGVNYSQTSVSSNGWISFNLTPGGNYLTNDLTSLGNIVPALMPLWDDVDGGSGNAYYQTTGVAPNRVFTFEWRNWEWSYSSNTPVISFQVKLFETTNIIQFVYRQEAGANVNPSATIGIARTVADYQTLPNAGPTPLPSSAVFNTGIATKPATDQIYQWTPPPPCSGNPVAGAATLISGCPSSVALLGSTVATNLTYQWQSRPLCGTSTWTNIPGATSWFYNIISLSQPSEFRAYIICNSGGASDTSTLVSVQALAPCPCTQAASSTGDEDIFNVTLGNMTNSSTCATTGGPGSIQNRYSDYSSVLPAYNVSKGASLPFSVQVGTCGGNYSNAVAAYIDFNRDGVFNTAAFPANAAGEMVYLSPSSTVGPHTENGTVTISANASSGLTRLRVVNVETGSPSSIGPCSAYSWGETEDYLINIIYTPTATGGGVFCSGDSITLVATAPGITNPKFIWTRNNVVVDTTPTISFIGSSLTSGNYTVRVLTFSCVGGAPDTSGATVVNVTVYPTPAKPIVAPVIVYCQGDVFDSIPVFGENLKWYSVATGGVAGPAPQINTSVASTVTYYVSQTIDGCESPRAAVTISVAPKPLPPDVVSPVGYCQGDPAVPLMAQGQNLRWYSVASGGVGTPIAPTPTTNAQGTFTWYVTQTVAGCESNRSPVVVNISYVPNGLITLSRPFVCQYDTLTLGYFGNALPSADYIWTLPAGASVESGNGQGPLVVRFDSAGLQTVRLSVDNAGCKGPDALVEVPVHVSPKLAIDMPADVCQDEMITLAITFSTIGIDSFDWNFDGAEVVYGSFPRGPYGLRWNTPGTKTVSVIATDNTCKSKPAEDQIIVRSLPNAKINVSGNNVCAGDSIMFSADFDPGASYLWQPRQYFGESNSSTVWGVIDFGTFVKLDVTNSFNCKSSDSIWIEAKSCCQVYFPSAFSPNGDGRNDLFRMLTVGKSKNAQTSAHQISVFRIANRWGQTVFETADERTGWDGTYNGKPQDIGTYHYYVKYKCSDGNFYEEKGEVTLVR